MNTRKIFVTIELDTDELLKTIRTKEWWQEMISNYYENLNTEVVQVQVNVSNSKKKK